MRQHFEYALFITLFILGAAVIAAVPAASDERTMNDEIAAAASEIEAQLIEARRWFHAHPELSNLEVETAAEIARRLREMGYEVETRVAHNGVVAVLEGALPGPVVAWRADIDALPIDERVDVPYRSTNAGVMHACGHDVHTPTFRPDESAIVTGVTAAASLLTDFTTADPLGTAD